ncbi:hypothetical protein [Rubritalea sp.]|uniref:hypothetical protein n=1 Tax=Rubritalea sp. TaxID=2109375 RepID=UPI003EFAE0F5
MSPLLELTDGHKTVDKVVYAPVYLKCKDAKADVSKIKLTLLDEKNKDSVSLMFEYLNNVDMKNFNLNDLKYLEEGFSLKLWIPVDQIKYKEWKVTHNQAKGSIVLAFYKVVATDASLEEEREKYMKLIQKK